MTPLLASDFGNLTISLLGGAALLIALVLFVVGLLSRQRQPHVIAAVLALVGGIAFLGSSTLGFGVGGLLLSAVAMTAAARCRAR